MMLRSIFISLSTLFSPMEIELDLNKSVEENAGKYFEAAKKAKKKLEGAKKALQDTQEKLELLQKQESKFLEETAKKQERKEKKREWYEKFHWFISSEGFLCIGGKDATSNELVIKKHMEKNDVVLHTDMAGSPFFVIKNGQEAGEETIKEAAQAVRDRGRGPLQRRRVLSDRLPQRFVQVRRKGRARQGKVHLCRR